MRSILRSYSISLFIIAVIVSGCSLFVRNKMTPEEVKKQIDEAMEHFEEVKSLGIEEAYSEEFAKAEAKLARAKELFESNRRDYAYSEAKESLEISRRIIRKFYLDTVSKLARKAREELERKAGGDADNPLTGYVSKLDKVLEDAEAVRSDLKVVSLNKVIDDLKEVLQITHSIETSTAKTLESDVSFDKGKYELSEDGKEVLQKLVERIMAEADTYIRDHPDKNLITKIKVVGYTDRLDFARGTDLVRELREGSENEFPQRKSEQRQFLNQRLSELRARTIVKYIEEFISISEKKESGFQIDTEAVGRGEKMPANLPPPYPNTDFRRRICKIYTYTTVY
ncbi:OmpA family protein [Desulfobacterales bacterium HSG2]|nr:OmpA family protein [Desulfobacterales bacterium HSG2]